MLSQPETQPRLPRQPYRSQAPRQAPRQASPQTPRWRRAWRRLALAAGLLCLAGALLAGVVGWAYLRSLPSVADAPQRVQAILSAHGGVAVSVPPPQKVGQAVVAVEDSRFYSNHGIDVLSMLHFAWGYLTTGSTNQGGATISEQLVKILYVRDPTTLSGKVEMLGLALKLNQRFTKPEILAMYLNGIYYGHQAYGIAQASATYFHTAPGQLNWGEASMLAGLPQSPSGYDPFVHFALARERQAHVLSRLVATGVLTQAQATQAYAETPALP